MGPAWGAVKTTTHPTDVCATVPGPTECAKRLNEEPLAIILLYTGTTRVVLVVVVVVVIVAVVVVVAITTRRDGTCAGRVVALFSTFHRAATSS